MAPIAELHVKYFYTANNKLHVKYFYMANNKHHNRSEV